MIGPFDEFRLFNFEGSRVCFFPYCKSRASFRFEGATPMPAKVLK